MKVSFKVKSFANVALVKYWGRSDEENVIPANASVSITIPEFFTESEFFYGDLAKDEYEYEGNTEMAVEQIKRVRDFFMKRGTLLPFVKVVSKNNFVADAGMASSASSMSALTKGLFELASKFGGKYEESDLVEMTRLSGSASAVRSLYEGVVIYDPLKPTQVRVIDTDLKLVDVPVLICDSSKKVSSAEGHKIAASSYLFDERVSNVNERVDKFIAAITDCDLEELGSLIEEESISFLLNHYTSEPRLQYLIDKSIELVYKVKLSGIPAYFTFDAGCNPHFITAENYKDELRLYLS